MIEVTPELLRRYDRPGPRYTSYPTAVEFSDEFSADDYAARLSVASERQNESLSLYVHLPFCESRCSFCACHVVITRDPEVTAAYVDRLIAEARLLARHLGDRRTLVQYHWGGGTPTHHSPEVLARIHGVLGELFEVSVDAEVAVEVDPRVTTRAHLELLSELGFNRMSLGVQDLDPTVQELIGRGQTYSQTRRLYEASRELGFSSINFDLIYGLPGQDLETMSATLDSVIEMRPDRLAVYSFAYVPWMRPHQRRIDEDSLPDTDNKFALLAQVVTRLTDAGYRQIGMDHFALPDDELSVAASNGTLNRNFMGYTTHRDTEVVALGSSGISDVGGAYAQNHRRLASYYESVDGETLPVERGYVLDRDDLLRRWVITEIMCNGTLDYSLFAERFGVDAESYFGEELGALDVPGGPVAEGMVEVSSDGLHLTELGRLFVRRVAVLFDAYTSKRPMDRPVFSRTV